MTANALIAVLNKAKANQIDVKITELDNGDIGCTVSCGSCDESFTVGTLEHLVRRLDGIVYDWGLN